MRDVNGYNLFDIAETFFKILQAHAFDHKGNCAWAVELAVGRGLKEVHGWVFLDRYCVELRFETCPSMEPPGFLSGAYLSQGLDDSALAMLLDVPSEEDLADIEAAVRDFIGRCRFCVRSIMDVATGTPTIQATAYRYGCATIPIKRSESCRWVR